MAGTQGQQFGAWRLHADQSYLGRPIDPDVVSRVRDSLDQYQGPRSRAEQEAIIAARAGEVRKANNAVSKEYWEWTHRVKETAVPTFKLPEDPRKGMPSQESRIRENVEKGKRDMRKMTAEHKQWVASVQSALKDEQMEKVKQKAAADELYNQDQLAREEKIKQKYQEQNKQKKQKENEYWRWHRQMKERVSQRPCSAPPPKNSGVESASSMSHRKAQETQRINREISSEYSMWLKSVSCPSFTPPTVPVDHERQARLAAMAEERTKQMRKLQKEYKGEVESFQQKHHKRIMGMVRQRLENDRKFNDAMEFAKEELAMKAEGEKKKQRAVAAKTAREIHEIKKRVKAKPLFLEVAYKKV